MLILPVQEWDVMPDLFFYREIQTVVPDDEQDSEEEGEGEDEENAGNYLRVEGEEVGDEEDEDDDWAEEGAEDDGAPVETEGREVFWEKSGDRWGLVGWSWDQDFGVNLDLCIRKMKK